MWPLKDNLAFSHYEAKVETTKESSSKVPELVLRKATVVQRQMHSLEVVLCPHQTALLTTEQSGRHLSTSSISSQERRKISMNRAETVTGADHMDENGSGTVMCCLHLQRHHRHPHSHTPTATSTCPPPISHILPHSLLLHPSHSRCNSRSVDGMLAHDVVIINTKLL